MLFVYLVELVVAIFLSHLYFRVDIFMFKSFLVSSHCIATFHQFINSAELVIKRGIEIKLVNFDLNTSDK